MIKNYLKIAYRNLLRHKAFSFINIASLTLGIIGCLVIGLFVWDEWKFDKSIPGADKIYRIYQQRTANNIETNAAVVPPAISTYLQQSYPEVDTTLRILMTGDKYLFETGNKNVYEEKGFFVEPSIFTMFSLNLEKGDVNTALKEMHSVVITTGLAKKYFGNENPLGKIIKIDKTDFAVTGVLAKLPSHFHLDFNYLMPLAAAEIPEERMKSWGWSQFYTYIKLKPGSRPDLLQDKFHSYIEKEIKPVHMQEGSSFLPLFQPLKDVHLRSSDFVYDKAIRGNETYVKGLIIIALFVMIIACFNFVNLATARSFRRAKEIGVRKVIGAEKNQLVFQFLTETVLLAFISVIIAVVTVLIIVPTLNNFANKSISFNPLSNPLLGLALLESAVLIGLVAGIYPALILSGFKPITVLKKLDPKSVANNTNWLRQGLVVVQFALSALLIISSIIVYRQIKFLNTKDVGFSKEQLVYFQLRGDVERNIETFKAELLRIPNVVSVTAGYGLPGDQYAGDQVSFPGDQGDKTLPSNVFMVDHDYVKTLGLKIIAGRDFSRNMSTDTEEAFIINETAVSDFGFVSKENALGKRINFNKWEPDSLNPVKKGKIVGVVQDFHYKSLHEKVTASVLQINPNHNFKAAVKLKTVDLKNTIASMEKAWNSFSPGYPLDYKFMDETYAAMYTGEQKLSKLLWIFTFMAIVVGCMGLFALSAFTAQQRTKEMGIRKVLGAGVFNIVGLLSRSLLKPVFIASVIAFPLAWLAMNNWLQQFPYRVSISWWIFAIATIAALVIAFITVSFQSIRAATRNPVNSLRSE